MIVVFSFSISTRFALPSMARVTFSSLMPRSSLITWPPLRICDVFEHRLAAIAEARRLHRGDLQTAAQLVHHQRGQGLALDILGDDQQRLAGLHDALQQRQHAAAGPDSFFSWIRT